MPERDAAQARMSGAQVVSQGVSDSGPPVCFLFRQKIKARKFRVDGFVIEAFACQLHLGSVNAIMPGEDIDQSKHQSRPSPPTDSPDRHSPSLGTTSGTTQSMQNDGSPDEPVDQGKTIRTLTYHDHTHLLPCAWLCLCAHVYTSG